MYFEDFFVDLNEFTPANQIIGKGTHSTVYLITENSTEKQFASKELNPKLYTKKDDLKQLMREVTNMSRLNHLTIVRFKGFNFRSFTDNDNFHPTIITQYVGNKNLRQILDDVRHELPPNDWNETKQFIILLGISDAMRYLHKNNIIHLNLTAENVLLDKDLHPYINGFSHSRNLPESMVASQPDSPIFIGFKVDVFSFALIAYEILTKKSPSEAKRQLSKGKLVFPSNVNQNIKTLIHDCLDSDPNKRPNFDEIFQKISSDQLCEESPEILEYLEKLSDSNQRIQPDMDNLDENNEIVQTFDTIINNGMYERILIKKFLFQIMSHFSMLAKMVMQKLLAYFYLEMTSILMPNLF